MASRAVRGGNRRLTMADIAMAVLSVFLMQSPPFRCPRTLAEGCSRPNAHTVFALPRIPCDTRIRQMLDGVPTAHFNDEFHVLAGGLRRVPRPTPRRS